MQGRRCFFCDETIPAGEASVEHLVASANGGSNEDDNCVVCCKALNSAFGSKPYKEKLRAVLSHRGQFVCPRQQTLELASSSPAPITVAPTDDQLTLVLADLARRGAARPRKEKTLRNTIAAVFEKKLAEEELSDLLARLQAKDYVRMSDGKVDYKLPARDV